MSSNFNMIKELIRDYKFRIYQQLQLLISQLLMAKSLNIALILLIVVFVNSEIIKQSNLQIDNSGNQASPTSSSTIHVIDPALEKIINSYLESRSKGNTNQPPTDQNTTLIDIFNRYNSTNPYKGQTIYTNPFNDLNTTLLDLFTRYNSTNPYKTLSTSRYTSNDLNTTLWDIFNKYNSTNPYKGQSIDSRTSSELPPSNLTPDQLALYQLSHPNVKGLNIDQDTPLNQEEALILVQLLKKSGLKIGSI